MWTRQQKLNIYQIFCSLLCCVLSFARVSLKKVKHMSSLTISLLYSRRQHFSTHKLWICQSCFVLDNMDSWNSWKWIRIVHESYEIVNSQEWIPVHELHESSTVNRNFIASNYKFMDPVPLPCHHFCWSFSSLNGDKTLVRIGLTVASPNCTGIWY